MEYHQKATLLLSLEICPPNFELPFNEEAIVRYPLRGYQFEMIADAIDLMRQGVRRVLIRAPTGAGKTVMATAMLGCARQHSQFVVHRKELIKQTSRTFTANGLRHGIVATGWEFQFDADVVIAGVQTLIRRMHLTFPPRLLVIDECHHATSQSWARVLDYYPDAWVIGLTATPERLDGRGLDEQFDAMVVGPSEAELIEQGWLSPFDYYAPDIPDMTGVPSVGGDFVTSAVAKLVDEPKLIGSVVEHYLRLCPGEQGIVFGASRQHSRNIAAEFVANGVSAMHVDGSMSEKERDYFDDAFRAGDIRIGLNCDLFSEGYDVPNISYLGDASPSRSRVKVRQRWGRPLRVHPGKSKAIICDHAGNAIRLGDFPDYDYPWSLQGRAVRERTSGANDALPVRQCKQCFRVSPSTVEACPSCGTEFPAQVRTLRQEEGQLTKLERVKLKEERRIQRKIEERQCKTPDDFIRLAEQRGYPNPRGWMKIHWKLKHGGRIT
jgi:DNA repair protein RadD